MRIVKVIKPSKKYNTHIQHKIGTICRIDEEGDDYFQITTVHGGMGAIDKDAVQEVHPDTLSMYEYNALTGGLQIPLPPPINQLKQYYPLT